MGGAKTLEDGRFATPVLLLLETRCKGVSSIILKGVGNLMRGNQYKRVVCRLNIPSRVCDGASISKVSNFLLSTHLLSPISERPERTVDTDLRLDRAPPNRVSGAVFSPFCDVVPTFDSEL
jgi:hypothetical protein